MTTVRHPYVLIVEDHPLVADSLKACIHASYPDLRVSKVESLQAALATLIKWPDPLLILTDLNLADADGTDAVRKLRLAAPNCKLLVCTALEDPTLRAEAKALGAVGYVVKSASIQTLRQHISATIGHCPPFERAGLDSASNVTHPLTTRQEAVLEELSSGRSNKEIAIRMNITVETVGSHMKEILRRLRVKNRTEAVTYYFKMKERRREDPPT
jgi:DNA-binding NarL/FixJ family response regulator